MSFNIADLHLDIILQWLQFLSGCKVSLGVKSVTPGFKFRLGVNFAQIQIWSFGQYDPIWYIYFLQIENRQPLLT